MDFGRKKKKQLNGQRNTHSCNYIQQMTNKNKKINKKILLLVSTLNENMN